MTGLIVATSKTGLVEAVCALAEFTASVRMIGRMHATKQMRERRPGTSFKRISLLSALVRRREPTRENHGNKLCPFAFRSYSNASNNGPPSDSFEKASLVHRRAASTTPLHWTRAEKHSLHLRQQISLANSAANDVLWGVFADANFLRCSLRRST